MSRGQLPVTNYPDTFLTILFILALIFGGGC